MELTETEFQTLVLRIEKLEVRNRRWKLAFTLFSLSMAFVVAMGAKTAQRIEPSILRVNTVEARDIILRGQEGRVCARFSVTPIVDRTSDHVSFVTDTDSPDRALLKIYSEEGTVAWTAPPSPMLIPAK
jgi:hypothetical protein